MSPDQARRAFRFEAIDVIIAMTVAGLINAAMLIMAATTFNATRHSSIGSIDPSRTLVFSQVILSFCLPAALIPLVLFTSRRDLMGGLVNRAATTALASVVVALILALNLVLVSRTLVGAS